MNGQQVAADSATVPLLCFPFGGSGAGFFRGWPAAPGIELLPVQLAGREERFHEDAHGAMADLLADLLPTVRRLVAGRERVALFGHCLGAVIAYEVARALRAGGSAVSHLFVSGALAPGRQQRRLASGLPDAAFVVRIRENGYDHPALDDPELLEIVLPTLRADVALLESYRPGPAVPVDLPITAIRGAGDAHVGAQDAAEWAAFTSAAFALHDVPGDHMYLARSPADALRLVGRTLAPQPA